MTFVSQPIQYVQVPVPAHLVPEVMALITGDAASLRTTLAWSEKEIHKLWTESAQNIRKTLVYLSLNVGKSVSGEVIAHEVLGKDEKGHSVAGMMGAFNRRCKGRHRGKNPIVAEFDANANVWLYSIRPDVAEVLLRLMKQGQEETA